MTQPIPVHTIHDALEAAAAQKKSGERLSGVETVPTSVRLTRELREVAEEICQANGADLGGFMRRCVVALVQDYVPRPEAVESLDSAQE